ncbi:MAG: zf-HC2 domain-containing protein [Acidobacteria bacterium]|nr:zf-HC2 domain-containing protein [Acidobacteriota bacterium]
MNCVQARFLLYAHLERDISKIEAEALSRHLSECDPCEARARSARGLAQVLRSHRERSPAPSRLRQRLHQGDVRPPRFEYPLLATAAVVLLLLVPLVADVSSRPVQTDDAGLPSATSGIATLASLSASRGPTSSRPTLVSRQMTGTLVCLDCESRVEAGLCPLPQAHHEAAFCAENGEVWRLMSRDPAMTSKSAGQTLTVEGVGFPQSGFLRASRAGY